MPALRCKIMLGLRTLFYSTGGLMPPRFYRCRPSRWFWGCPRLRVDEIGRAALTAQRLHSDRERLPVRHFCRALVLAPSRLCRLRRGGTSCCRRAPREGANRFRDRSAARRGKLLSYRSVMVVHRGLDRVGEKQLWLKRSLSKGAPQLSKIALHQLSVCHLP